ncbi:MAG: ribosomal protein S18-alanine N-acetyltransferase [Christensenellales bacterium]
MNTVFRCAAKDDIKSIYMVETQCFTRPWSYVSLLADLTGNEFARYLVAELKGHVIGYCSMHTVVDEGHIMNMAVLPDYRRKGIAEKLLKTMIALSGLNYFTLEVRMSNFGAVRLYEKLGFEIIGRRPNYYGDEDALIMWRGKTRLDS